MAIQKHKRDAITKETESKYGGCHPDSEVEDESKNGGCYQEGGKSKHKRVSKVSTNIHL